MVKLYPFIFILLWSSAFVTTKPIVDNSEPFSALAFRFFIVALGFYIFSYLNRLKIIISKKNIIQSMLTGVLFHGLYLGPGRHSLVFELQHLEYYLQLILNPHKHTKIYLLHN